jgi:membrane protease YdiL (CAAX protease family)
MGSAQVIAPRQASLGKRTGISLLAGYFALYGTTLLTMRRAGNFDVTEPLLVLAILGFGFSLAAWLLTIRVKPLEYSIKEPKKELAVILAYLAPVMAFITWGLGPLHRYVPADPGHAIAILVAKLVVAVVIPMGIMRAVFGYSFRGLAPMAGPSRHVVAALGMSVLMLALQAVLGRGLRDIASAHLPAPTLAFGFPLVFVWLALEAGVVEEFFFRVLLQSRLSAALKSELGGIVLMSLLFGLAHAPGLYLRTALTLEGLPAHPSLLMAVGYSIVIVSVGGFFIGVLWARTRNFAVVVVVHAMGDLLPNLLPTLRSLRLLG